MTGEAEDHVLNTVSDKRTLSGYGRQLAVCNPLQNEPADLDPSVAEYLRAAYADNTARAYTSDLKHFRAWGGDIPSAPQMIAQYLAAYAKTLGTRTLRRRLAALAHAHAGQDIDPTKSSVVARLMRGIARRHERPPRQANPLLLADLDRICAIMGDDARATRDRALLLLGFFAALRRSEIAALERGDVQVRPDGLLISIRRSKTDQTGRGRRVFVPARIVGHCPAKALCAWTGVANSTGPLFFSHPGQRMSDRSIARVVQRWAQSAGLHGHFSGHSLRAGFVTSAALSGADVILIARQTGHRSIQSLSSYVRPTPDSALSAAHPGMNWAGVMINTKHLV